MNDREDGIAILTMLTRVGEMSGEMDEREELLIRTIALKLGLDEQTTDDILAGRIRAEITPPRKEVDRIPYFHMCVMASGINGDFDDREVLFCKKLGMRLGLRDDTLDKAIALFKEYYPKSVPVEILKRTFQIDHN
ncbi:MAG: hypothetical protein HKN79_09650 [Flavobacteriales bacterium]|nr:hypothetical protein [Flavobacteriales bacterium]